MLAAVLRHRDQALNAHVILQADNAALKRALAQQEARVKGLQDELATYAKAPANSN